MSVSWRIPTSPPAPLSKKDCTAGDPVTGYLLQERLTGGWSNVNPAPTPGATAFLVPGLEAGTRACFRLIVVSATGRSQPTDRACANVGGGRPTPESRPPCAPVDIAVTPRQAGEVVLSWRYLSSTASGGGCDASSAISALRAQIELPGGWADTDPAPKPGDTALVVTGLPPGERQCFRMYAVAGDLTSKASQKACGKAGGTPVPATLPPCPVVNLQMAPSGPGAVVVSWRYPTKVPGGASCSVSQTITAVRVQVRLGGGWSNVDPAAKPGDTALQVSGLPPATNECFRVITVAGTLVSQSSGRVCGPVASGQ